MRKKQCHSCKEQKDLSEFNKDKSKRDGLSYRCKCCTNKYLRNYTKTLEGHLRACFYNIIQRCDNPKHRLYKWYGGRGICCLFETVYEFIDYVITDLNYNTIEKLKGLTIDRIDNNGDYRRGNIQFVTQKVNCNNRRNKTF